MKKLLLIAITALIAGQAKAELPSDGYYRVQNAYTKRYAYLLDNKGTVNETSYTVDVGALELYKNPERIHTDPAGIFYIQKAPVGTVSFDIYGQGTSVYGFLERYLEIIETRKPYDGRDAYMLSGTDGTATKYIGDVRKNMDNEVGIASSEATEDDRKWYLNKVDASDSQYFGIEPSLEAGGKYYQPFFAGFPISAYSEGMKFFSITGIDSRGAAILTEIEGTIPAGTAVIVECSHPSATSNRLNVGPFKGGTDPAGNLLKGVYFDNDSRSHWNRTRYNKQTMRVLGVKDGKLAFVEGDMEYLPRNQAYLQLTNAEQYPTKDFIVMTREEYDASLGSVGVIPATATVDVYGLDGRLVKAGIVKEEVPGLGKGLYIVRSGASAEKIIVK